MTDSDMVLDFRAMDESTPGARWLKLMLEFWPSYQRWYLRDSASTRPSLETCADRVRQHLPEMEPVWRRMAALVDHDDLMSRFLSLYSPPPVRFGCSQAIVKRDGVHALVRNYDYSPQRSDGIILKSAWCDTPVIATTDCLAGALDGINAHGFAAALSFGGRRVVDDGFGAPMVVRYLLETCRTTEQAIECLHRIPIHMAYNFTLADAEGDSAIVFMSPGRPPAVHRHCVCTNHQDEDDWPEYVNASASKDRYDAARIAVMANEASVESVVSAFQDPPLFQRNYGRASGTLYTVVFDLHARSAEYIWPTLRRRFDFESFSEGTSIIQYEGNARRQQERTRGR